MVIEQFIVFDGIEDVEKLFADQVADGLTRAESVQRRFLSPGERARTIIGAARYRLCRDHAFHHADITTD